MPENNPYAPPLAEIGDPRDHLEVDAPPWQAATLWLSGWLGLILAVLLFVIFGLGIYFECKRMVAEEGVFDVASHREWIVRMTFMPLACLIGAVSSWHLIRLRGRLFLTLVTIVPLPAMFFCYLLTRVSAHPRPVEHPWNMALASTFALPFSFVILFVLWSSKNAFSQSHAKGRTGCLTIIGALAFVFSEGVAYTVLVLSAAGIMYLFRLTP